MSYPSNPREIRSQIEAIHVGYVRGDSLFPRGRLLVEPEDLPTKSQAIARALMKDWQHIDEDDAFFRTNISILLGRIDTEKGESARVVTTVGLNAVKWAQIESDDGKPVIFHGVLSTEEASEIFDENMPLNDGRDIGYSDGILADRPSPDLQLVREGRYGEPILTGLFLGNIPDLAEVA